MSDELNVLKSVTARLEGADIFYMVTGSMAANFYAVPRMTRDIDLVIELSEQDVDRVTHLFQQEYYIDRDMVLRAVRDQAMFNIIHNALVVKVDCVVRKETENRRESLHVAGRSPSRTGRSSLCRWKISSFPSWIGPRRAGPRCNWTMSGTCSGQCRDSIPSI